MTPIPCSHCGMNFMRRDLNPDAPKLCNNCLKPKENNVSTVKILLECDRQTQIDIEEICINEGINFSEYFLELHKSNMIGRSQECCDSKVKSPEDFHKKFEALAKTDAPIREEKKSKGAKK